MLLGDSRLLSQESCVRAWFSTSIAASLVVRLPGCANAPERNRSDVDPMIWLWITIATLIVGKIL